MGISSVSQKIKTAYKSKLNNNHEKAKIYERDFLVLCHKLCVIITTHFHFPLKFSPSFEFTWLCVGNYLRTISPPKINYTFLFSLLWKKIFIYIYIYGERERDCRLSHNLIVFLIAKKAQKSFLTIFPWLNAMSFAIKASGFITLGIA